jgi:hypothetical protein
MCHCTCCENTYCMHAFNASWSISQCGDCTKVPHAALPRVPPARAEKLSCSSRLVSAAAHGCGAGSRSLNSFAAERLPAAVPGVPNSQVHHGQVHECVNGSRIEATPVCCAHLCQPTPRAAADRDSVWNRVAVILFVVTTSALLLVGLVKDHVRLPACPLRGAEHVVTVAALRRCRGWLSAFAPSDRDPPARALLPAPARCCARRAPNCQTN